jgi:hypothetical protein
VDQQTKEDINKRGLLVWRSPSMGVFDINTVGKMLDPSRYNLKNFESVQNATFDVACELMTALMANGWELGSTHGNKLYFTKKANAIAHSS